jgi:hypothetical protein
MLRRQGPRDNGYTLEIQDSSPTLQFRMTQLTLMRNLQLSGWDCCGPWTKCQVRMISVGFSTVREVANYFLGTTSSEWGSKEVATARATIEPTITPQNENLVRTYHPSLGPVDGVWVTKESNEKSIWLVAPGPLGIPHTHAGGREIHFLPAGLSPRTMTMICFKAQPDPIKAVLNPRRFLQSHDLHVIREMFPLAVGARVLISGFIVILFKSRADVEKSWTQDGEACTFGNLRLLYDVMEDSPTRTEVSGGAAIASKPDALETSVTLRLKLRLLDGQEVITVPTHAFVKLRRINGSCLRRLADWYAWMKTTLSRFTPAGKDSHEPALGTMRGSARNSPLGKIVFLAGDSRKVRILSSLFYCRTPDDKYN